MDELKQDGNSKSVVGDSYSCFYCSFKCPEEREVEKHILDMHVPPKHLTEETEDNHEKRENKKYAIMDDDRLPQGEGVPGMLNTSNLCPDSAPKHHPIIKPSISGFASSMGLQMSGHAISMANLHAKRRCLGMQSASSWNLNDEMDSLETKYLAYSFQCGNLQLHSNPREIFSPECKPSWPIVQFNQMYQLFLMGENLNHYANQNFNLHSTGNEKNMAQENRISSREELRSPINEYASASGTSMHTICADCPVERDYAHRNDKNAARIRNSLPNEGQIVTGSRSKVEKITSCVNTRSIQNVPTEAKIYEIKESGRSDGDSVSIDANTKRSRAEKESPLECRVTRSHLRRRTDPTDTAERKFRSFTVGQEENSGDILLSKLRKFFNDSLPKFNTAANSEGNSTPQDCNEQARKASPAIFTIDLSSDDETTD
ncbi:hypothetical protein GE061_015808 [Apolygus lucorum]|uniref:C2H2-type domain-containing protein n=1 Tax=Apolygus lucorum TaxID=248454 RepID=A0A8S9XLY2_APOLU|nr:hypothetical protein GE061_015808 [Apolygus lucorum]